MRELIGLEGISDPSSMASGSAALDLQDDRSVTLRFKLAATDGPAIEAIRHARRAMLREEWTIGRGPDEPSLEQAIFSSVGVVWEVPASQQAWCLQKMDDLVARAGRALEALEAGKA
ncbi:MAG: hypothetical protein ACRD1B_08910 [Thermoanaerobaculia bacterium]